MTLSAQILKSLGKGYDRVGYRFSDNTQRGRFERATSRASGAVILRDLIPLFKRAGAVVPSDLEPRSVYQPDMLIDPMVKYLRRPVCKGVHKDAMSFAVSRVMRAFYVGKLEPTPLEKVPYRPDTNAGAPYFRPKGECAEQAFAEARMIMRGKSPQPLTVFHRGKSSEEVRPVYGYPFAMTLLESRFFQPYQRNLMDHHSPYVGGKMESEIAGCINELRLKSSAVVELDYSGFDGSISAKLIHTAFQVIENCFEMNAEDKKVWEVIKRYFITAPMLLPDGNMIKGRRHGVPSGSMFTQIIDSIVNAIAIEYVKRRLEMMTSRYYILGDDCVIGVVGRAPSITKISGIVAELGLSINMKKSRITKVRSGQRVYFLGHNRQSFILRRPVEETIRKILTPERVDQRLFSKDQAVRTEALVERLRAYQEDNQMAWSVLQKVINQLTHNQVERPPEVMEWIFVPNLTHLERTRYDYRFYQFVHSVRGRQFTRLAYCLGT